MSISFQGYDTKYITTKCDKNVKVGDLVTINEHGTACTTIADENFIGVVVARREDLVTIQEQGYVEVKFVGTIADESYIPLVANANNIVKADEAKSKHRYKTLKVDNANGIIGFLL